MRGRRGPDHPAAQCRKSNRSARVSCGDAAWSGLREHLDEPEVLELLVLAGWYRTIAYVANGARIEPEPWALALPGTDRPSG
ncbi:hypothetical protein ACFRH4_34275 [Streptomyces mirabilis]|uniref:hypothetical protein n=1 Tax=Streptomyces mirabilis TaxID=68239 RepID=UPI0036A38C49